MEGNPRGGEDGPNKGVRAIRILLIRIQVKFVDKLLNVVSTKSIACVPGYVIDACDFVIDVTSLEWSGRICA